MKKLSLNDSTLREGLIVKIDNELKAIASTLFKKGNESFKPEIHVLYNIKDLIIRNYRDYLTDESLIKNIIARSLKKIESVIDSESSNNLFQFMIAVNHLNVKHYEKGLKFNSELNIAELKKDLSELALRAATSYEYSNRYTVKAYGVNVSSWTTEKVKGQSALSNTKDFEQYINLSHKDKSKSTDSTVVIKQSNNEELTIKVKDNKIIIKGSAFGTPVNLVFEQEQCSIGHDAAAKLRPVAVTTTPPATAPVQTVNRPAPGQAQKPVIAAPVPVEPVVTLPVKTPVKPPAPVARTTPTPVVTAPAEPAQDESQEEPQDYESDDGAAYTYEPDETAEIEEVDIDDEQINQQ